MFYWKQKTESGTTLENELLNCQSVTNVYIASAFLSREGIRILEKIKNTYSLRRENIQLYLSAQFSGDRPHELLEQLSSICVTKIVFEPNFHPKVYFMKGNPSKLIYGSSNFTTGGMERNIEFDYIGKPSPEEVKSVTTFFSCCDYHAKKVDSVVIQYYRDNHAKISELRRRQKELTSVLTGFTRQNDAFSPDDFDLDEFYFTFEDYETFFDRNRQENGSDIRAKRKKVQRKMLDIHELIYPQIKRLGIDRHKSDKHITSLIDPHPVNYNSVGWLAVRYGKTPKEVDILKSTGDVDYDGYGFQKHGCLQFSIYAEGFDINLFLAVRNDAVDRDHLTNNLSKLRSKIENEIETLQEQESGLVWIIWDTENDTPITFDFDEEEASAFCDFFVANDRPGRESYMQKYYSPDDPILLSKESIGEEVLRVVKLLLPLYNTIVWRPKV
jgi:HKD family nuclease